MIDKIIKWLKKKFPKLFPKRLTPHEYYNELRHYGKNALRKELIVVAQRANSNQCGVDVEFKKYIKTYSKKKLIRAIIYIRLKNNPKIVKLKRILGSV